jgi:hypothetical protein
VKALVEEAEMKIFIQSHGITASLMWLATVLVTVACIVCLVIPQVSDTIGGMQRFQQQRDRQMIQLMHVEG